MKKTVIYLLAAVLLVATSPASQASTFKPLTPEKANQILQKVSGTWSLNQRTWLPELRILSTFKGDANFSSSYLGDYVREQFTILQPNGITLKGEIFMRYSTEDKRFEIVQVDNTGKSVLLMAGKWYPEHNSLLFVQVEGLSPIKKEDKGMQVRYVFLQDGTFSKMIHKIDAKGNYYLASTSHYGHPEMAIKQ